MLCVFFFLDKKEPKNQGFVEKAENFLSLLKETSKLSLTFRLSAATDLPSSDFEILQHLFLFSIIRGKKFPVRFFYKARRNSRFLDQRLLIAS